MDESYKYNVERKKTNTEKFIRYDSVDIKSVRGKNKRCHPVIHTQVAKQ